MSEKDPYGQKRKDSTDESHANDEMTNEGNNDANPDMSGNSRNPKDDVNPVRPQTNMPNNKSRSDEDTDNTM